MDKEKEARAIARLKAFEPQDEPYYLCYSGGKDSDVIRILAKLAGVKHEIHHNLTTADAPETVRYVKSIPDVTIHRPKLSMWQLIVKEMYPPTRIARYCCEELKENGGKNRLKITGVRWAESINRVKNCGKINIIGSSKTVQKKAENQGIQYEKNKKGDIILNNDNTETRRFVEHCYRTTSTMVNPIVDWSDDDVWEFLHYYGCKSNPLYQCGYKRVGCIGCPLAGYKRMKEEFARYPAYRKLYVSAFDKMLIKRKEAGKGNDTWTDGESVMRWWTGDDPAQITFDDMEEEENGN